jgi:hypothetical protein
MNELAIGCRGQGGRPHHVGARTAQTATEMVPRQLREPGN